MFSKLLGLMLNCAAGEGSLACQGFGAVQTEMHQGLGESVVLSIRAPWAASPARLQEGGLAESGEPGTLGRNSHVESTGQLT